MSECKDARRGEWCDIPLISDTPLPGGGVSDNAMAAERGPFSDLKFLTDEHAVRNAAYFAAFARVSSALAGRATSDTNWDLDTLAHCDNRQGSSTCCATARGDTLR